jgi:ABC-2 type transport system ATP-binding protein
MIILKDLSKNYGSKQILKKINMEFSKGKVYGIVGENGAGKTTLFRCISGLEKFEGKITSELNPLKDHLGLLLTDIYYFNKITGKEYIQLLCNARGKKQIDIDERNIFDLPLNTYVSAYSTGMKKKLAITAILLQGNDYYIFDEPFNGVDIQSNILIAEIINKLRDLNKIVIISSHIFSTLSDTCDEIFILKEGEFIKTVCKTEFNLLEAEMKEVFIGDKIEKLGLI